MVAVAAGAAQVGEGAAVVFSGGTANRAPRPWGGRLKGGCLHGIAAIPAEMRSLRRCTDACLVIRNPRRAGRRPALQDGPPSKRCPGMRSFEGLLHGRRFDSQDDSIGMRPAVPRSGGRPMTQSDSEPTGAGAVEAPLRIGEPARSHSIAFREAFWTWVRVGLLSFGGPAGQIAVMHRILVEEKRWIGEGRFLHALNY